MIQRHLAFAVPGSIENRTGGTVYDRRVIESLRGTGTQVDHVELPASFPFPSDTDMDQTFARLATVPRDVPLIIDGLAYGALDPDRIGTLGAPLYPLVHHPLAEEGGRPEHIASQMRATERANLTHASHVFVTSPHTKVLLQQSYGVSGSDITVALPGVDPSTLPHTPSSPPLILSVGIQLPRKGHDVLIKALAGVDYLTWNAVIAGKALDADYSQTLTNLITTFDLGDRVELAGEVPPATLDSLFAKATLFALASRYEGYGMVFAEALAHGLPIVASGAGAVPDTVPEAAGIVVSHPNDPDAFADALRQMLTDADTLQAKTQGARDSGTRLPRWNDTAATFAATILGHTR